MLRSQTLPRCQRRAVAVECMINYATLVPPQWTLIELSSVVSQTETSETFMHSRVNAFRNRVAASSTATEVSTVILLQLTCEDV